MTPSNMRIRRATLADIDMVVQITKANRHFWNPQVDGSDALTRILERPDNLFLVCEVDGRVAGFVLGSWDGARAFIHKMSVLPDMQGQGIGSELVSGAIAFFGKLGAATVGVAAADGSEFGENDSTGFWKSMGFESIPARLMIYFDVQEGTK